MEVSMKAPSKEALYSQITQNHIKEEWYKHAQNVWNTFGCKIFGGYHDINLKADVLLLAHGLLYYTAVYVTF